jgi:hypothetical protein
MISLTLSTISEINIGVNIRPLDCKFCEHTLFSIFYPKNVCIQFQMVSDFSRCTTLISSKFRVAFTCPLSNSEIYLSSDSSSVPYFKNFLNEFFQWSARTRTYTIICDPVWKVVGTRGAFSGRVTVKYSFLFLTCHRTEPNCVLRLPS